MECSPRKSSEQIFQRERFQVKETSEIRVGRDAIGKKMLNEYRYVRTLANSQFGKVKLVISSVNAKHYALKLLHKSLLMKTNYVTID